MCVASEASRKMAGVSRHRTNNRSSAELEWLYKMYAPGCVLWQAEPRVRPAGERRRPVKCSARPALNCAQQLSFRRASGNYRGELGTPAYAIASFNLTSLTADGHANRSQSFRSGQ